MQQFSKLPQLAAANLIRSITQKASQFEQLILSMPRRGDCYLGVQRGIRPQ
jgi:hypothetical protein